MADMSGVSKTIIIPDGDDDYYYEELNDEFGNQQSLIEEISAVQRREVLRGKVSHKGQQKREVNFKMRQPHNFHIQNEDKGTKRRTNEEKRKSWNLPSTSKQPIVSSDLKRFNHKNEIVTPCSYQMVQTSSKTSPEIDTISKTNKRTKNRTQLKNTQENKKKEVPWSAIVHSISMNPRNAVKNASNVDTGNDDLPEDLSKERDSNPMKSFDADQQYNLEGTSAEQERKENQTKVLAHGSNVIPVVEYAQAECMSMSSQSSEENSALETQDLSVNKRNIIYYEPVAKADSAQIDANTQISVINSNPMHQVSSPPSQTEPAPSEQQQNEVQRRYLGMLQQPLNVNIEDQIEASAGQVWNVTGTPATQIPQETVQLSISIGDNACTVTPCALVQPVEVRGILQAPMSEASTTIVSHQITGTPLQLNIANVNINIILPQSVNSIIHDLIPVQPSRNTVPGQGLLALAQPQQPSANNMQNYEMISPTTTAQHETQQTRTMHVAPAQIHSAYGTYSVQSNSMPRMATGARRICHLNNQGLLRRDQYLPNYSGVPYQNITRNANPWGHNHPNSSYYHPVNPYNHHIPRHMARPPPPPYHINRCDCNHCPQTHNPYRTYNASNMTLNRQLMHDQNYPLNLQARRHPKS
ncbi:uncharacterized protein LOC106671141 isoform X2 [Cimex lectularius]|uniref:Uncharacterized protein n=1 Tax=Cimex lectularius TaxID=79782 RepID=A0A8I6TN38_CIMLE|nr:uncharacterized protein LOC106671141 isoform X2 [Cimex lectularius]